MNINSVILTGRMTKKIDMRYNASSCIGIFSIAVDTGSKKEDVSFFKCKAFNKTAELINDYTDKGSRVAIQGKISQGKWTDKEGKTRYDVSIIINTIEFLSKPDINTATQTQEEEF